MEANDVTSERSQSDDLGPPPPEPWSRLRYVARWPWAIFLFALAVRLAYWVLVHPDWHPRADAHQYWL